VVVGVILFLDGANAYDAAVGWAGIGVFFVGLIAYVALQGYKSMTKKKA
jgi:hypothetical protein